MKNFAALIVLCLCLSGFFVQPTQAISDGLVISQVFANGGVTGTSYEHDYIEIFNASTSGISLSGKSVQYANQNSSFNSEDRVSILPDVTLQAGKYFLI